MRPTVVDIARIAGVSRTTVSNVMNGRDKCTTAVRDRVLGAARELGYSRNMAAKTLVDHRSDLIGLVLPSYINSQLLTKSPFYNLVIDAVDSALRETSQYDLIIHCTPHSSDKGSIREWTMHRSLDGLILVGDFPDTELADLDRQGVPMVLIDSYECALNSPIRVNTDDEYGGYLAGRHLISQGCETFAVCTTDIVHSAVNQQRLAGFSRALGEAGYAYRHFEAQNNLFDGGMDLADRVMRSNPGGIFAVNDVLAAGLVKGLVARGCLIPTETRVIGFDNLDICTWITPSLSTIDQDIFNKATVAIRLLLEAVGGGIPARRIVLPVCLVERDS